MSAADSIRNCFVVIITLKHIHTHVHTHGPGNGRPRMADAAVLGAKREADALKTDRTCLNIILGVRWV